MATLVNYTCKRFIKLTQVEGIKIVFNYYLHPKYTATKIKSFFSLFT